MERVADKDDKLPLRFPVKMSNGIEVNEVYIRSGQVSYAKK